MTEERIDALEEQENVVEKTLHVERYKYAAEVINRHPFICKAEILDIACGFGYGSFILHKMTRLEVIGVDNDMEAINYANKRYKNHEIKFLVGDITELSFKNNSFSYIVCLETIEHVSRSQAVKALNELARVLKPNGLLIISTTNRKISNILYKIFGSNPYHLSEFTPDELKRKLESRNLKVTRKAAQYFYLPFIYMLGNKRLVPLTYFKPYEKIPAEIGRYFLLTALKAHL